jgi:lipocalin-like protein
MSRFRTCMLTGILAAVVVGCGSDNSGPNLPNLVGSWHATRIQVTNKANAAQTADLILLGATIQLVLKADHTFTATFVAPGEPPNPSNGTYTQTATTLTLTDDAASGGTVNVFTYTLSGGTLTVSGGEIDFDFGSGDVASKLDVTFVH